MTRLRRRPLLAALAAPGVARAQAPGSEVRLGALFPLTGPLALLGDECWRGLELAAEERNGAGGLIGRAVRLIRGDAADQAQAQAEARRLMAAERAHAVCGTATSPLGFAASQAAELQGVPYFELAAIADPLTERGFRYLFRTCPRASDFAQVAVAAVAELLAPAWGQAPEAVRVALLHEDGLYGQTVAGFQETSIASRNMTLAEKIAYASRGMEAAPLVQRLKAAGAEVVLHAGYQNDIVLFHRALREAGWRPRMVMGAGAGYSLTDTAHAIGPEFDGTMNVDFTQFEVNDRAAPGVRDFAELYRRRYGAEPRSGHSLAAYSGARLAFEAVQRAGATDKDRIRAAVLAADLPEGSVPAGWGARFDDKGQNLRARPMLLQWQGGRQVTLAPPEAAVASLRG